MQLRDQLLNASPYLSDTVMVNAAEKEEVLPNSIVTEIMAENPQSAKAENVLYKLNERTTPPSNNQMAQIHANDTVVGHKERLESKRDFYAGKKASEVYRLVRMYSTDTSLGSIYDSIEKALTNINTPDAYYQQAFCRFNKGDSTGVMAVLNNVTSDFDLSEAQNNYHNYFENYFNMLLSLQSQQKSFAEIDSTQKAVLDNVMNNSGQLLHAYTRNLLIYTNGLLYHEPYIEVDTNILKSAMVHNNIVYNYWSQNATFKLYPNPAREYITIEYNMDIGTAGAVIEIVDIQGKHIEAFRLHGTRGVKVIDLRVWYTGTYIIRLSVNGKTIQSDKFVKY